MKKLIPLVGMLAIVLLVLVISGSGTAAAQTGEKTAPEVQTGEPPAPVVRSGEPPNTANKLRLQLEGYMGFGMDSNKVGTTTDGNDVKISAGGGFGYGATIGYGLARSVDLDATLGFQASGLMPAVKNADGYFARSFLLATVKYKVRRRSRVAGLCRRKTSGLVRCPAAS